MGDLKNEKWEAYYGKRLLSRNRLLSQHHKLAVNFFLDYFKQVDINLKVLDVGCSEGFFMELLRNLGFENIKGIDPSSKVVEKAKKKGLIAEQNDIDEFQTKEKYDVILMMDVLEHLEKPEQALEKAYKLLNDNGALYLNIPICDSLALRCRRFLKLASRESQLHDWDETHINAYSKKELVSLLKACSFSVVKSQRISNRFPFISRISLKFSEFLQQFTLCGLFGDFLSVIAIKRG